MNQRFAWVLVGLLALVRTPAAASPPALTEDEAALLRWWDGLGYPDLRTLSLVRLSPPEGRLGGEPVHDHAFLLSDEGGTFRVFTTDLRTRTLERSAPGTKEGERVGYDPADLFTVVEAGIREMRTVAGPVHWSEGPDPFLLHRWAWPDQTFRLLVLARACAARERPDLAHALCDLALRERPVEEKGSADGPFSIVRAELAGEAWTVANEGFADEHLSWEEVRDGFRRFASGFPSHAKAKEAAAAVEVIDRMIAEAAERKGRPPQEPDDLAARVEDLVFRLREARGERWSWWPGGYDPEAAASPERELVEIGLPAVPRLVAALDDPSFTRSVLYFETGRGQIREGLVPYAVRILAYDLLDEIAGGAFRSEDGDAWEWQGTDEARAKVRPRVDAWWESVRAKGEEAVLSEAVAKGGSRARVAGARLVDRAGARALGPLREAIRRETNPAGAGGIVDLLGRVPGEEATDALLDLLAHDERPRVRLAASGGLLRRGRREGVTAMVEEWRHPSPQPIQADAGLPADPGFHADLLRFLAGSSDAEAYRVLGEGLAERPAGQRFAVLSSFLAPGSVSVFAYGESSGSGPAPRSLPLDEAARRALEDLLGARLGDAESVDGTWMTVGGVAVDTRLGHVAARALASSLPDLYAYEPGAPETAREEMRRRAEDLWRERRGLPALERPAPKAVAPPPRLPASRVEGPLDEIVSARSAVERAGRVARLEHEGIGALPAVLERLALLPADHAARPAIDALSRRLASVVTEVVLSPASAPPDEAFAKRMEEAKGKTLDARLFLGFVLHATRETPKGATGLRLEATRGEDLRGVVLTITLTKDLVEAGGSGGGWDRWGPSLSSANGGSGKGGSMALDYGLEERAWIEDAAEVEAAFLSPPATPVRLSFSVVRQR